MKTENAGPRVDYRKAAHKAIEAPWAIERYAHESNIERPSLELAKHRASKMSGCAYCVDMHFTDARAFGESEQRLYALNVWPETPFFTRRESAARAWTEAVIDISAEHVLNEVCRLTRERFDERQPVGSHDGNYLE